MINGFFNRLFFSFVLPPPLYTIPNAVLYLANNTRYHLDLCSSRINLTFLTASLCTARLLATYSSLTREHCRDQQSSNLLSVWPVSILSQSHSSPELPVAPTEESVPCSHPTVTLHNVPLPSPKDDDKQTVTGPCSLLEPLIAPAIVHKLPLIRKILKTHAVYQSCCRNRKYERSHSEAILPNIDIYGELKKCGRYSKNFVFVIK